MLGEGVHLRPVVPPTPLLLTLLLVKAALAVVKPGLRGAWTAAVTHFWEGVTPANVRWIKGSARPCGSSNWGALTMLTRLPLVVITRLKV